MDEDDNKSQEEEIEALVAIYDENLNLLPSTSGKSFEIRIKQALLRVNFPKNYPSQNGPSYEISAPFLSRNQKEELENQLKDVLNSFEGLPVVFSLAESIKEFLESFEIEEENVQLIPEKLEKLELSSVECPEIKTGDSIEDRKSVFQGHFAAVTSLEQVKVVLAKLYENRKIANATHNMYAYRIHKGNISYNRLSLQINVHIF